MVNLTLDERWRRTVAVHTEAIALMEPASGREWTFTGLAAEADSSPGGGDGMVCPDGTGSDFILAVLRAWRSGRVLCPVEPGQRFPEVPAPPPGIVHLKLTSGTGAAAKCVAFTAAQLVADVDAIVVAMGLAPGFPNLGAISLAHSYGFSSLVLPLLLHGIPLVLPASSLPAALASVMAAHPRTRFTLPAVPALWRAWHDAGVIPDTFHRAISAGAPLPPALEEGIFETTGIKVHNFLGSSECGGISYDRTESPRVDATFVGHALPDVRVARDAAGCLEVRGPAVGSRYWPEDDPCLRDGVFQAADLVEVGVGGEVFLRGRAGDVINVAGRKLSPEAVEAELLRHPAVRAALVLGLPAGGLRGDSVAAVVELRTTVSPDELRDFLLSRLPPWKVPREWYPVESLAPDRRGKLSRAGWRARLMDQRNPDRTPDPN